MVRSDDGREITAPCGCKSGVVETQTLYIQPCSLDCPVYLWMVEEARRAGKPVTYIGGDAGGSR